MVLVLLVSFMYGFYNMRVCVLCVCLRVVVRVWVCVLVHGCCVCVHPRILFEVLRVMVPFKIFGITIFGHSY